MARTDADTRPAQTLWVSGISGGGDALRDVETAIFDLARIVGRQEAAMPPIDPGVDGVVDVTFMLPGTFGRPEHTGIRTGRWVSPKRLLVVQVAVPESMGNTIEIREFLANALLEAARVAEAFFAIKKRPLTTARAREVAERAVAVLTG